MSPDDFVEISLRDVQAYSVIFSLMVSCDFFLYKADEPVGYLMGIGEGLLRVDAVLDSSEIPHPEALKKVLFLHCSESWL